MSTNNLLLSLLPNCSNNFRSSSLTSKNSISPFLSFCPRSSSTDNVVAMKQKPTIHANDKKWTPLLKIGHLLNVKIKKAFYFVFCKLEQFTKNNESKVTSMTGQDSREENTSNESIPAKQPKDTKIIDLNQRIGMAITILDDTCSTLKTKIQIRQQKQVCIAFFCSIKQSYLLKKGLQRIMKCMTAMKLKRYRQFFRFIEKYQSQKMRNQILEMTLERLYKNGLAKAMKGLKELKDLRVRLIIEKSFVPTVNHEVAKTPRSYYNNKSVNFSQKSKLQMTKMIQSDAGCQNHLLTARIGKSKKIVLREKKISTIEPITLSSKFTKAFKIRLHDDSMLDATNVSFENSNEFMSRLKNEKEQAFVHFLPDLIDNCNIFRELPLDQQIFKYQPPVKYDNCFTEVKNSIQLDTSQDCLTERHKQRQKTSCRQWKQTSIHSKHTSPGTALGRKMRGYVEQVGENSPLVKIDRILSKIQQMKSAGNDETTERGKKTVNVNIPRNIYETARKKQPKNTIDTVRTPLKENNSYQGDKYKSSMEKKGKERLMTEKYKENSSQKCSNFQLYSASKSKSTMLSKAKNEKQQLCTARKMKMEIQSLISRRNKQLNHNEPQLK